MKTPHPVISYYVLDPQGKYKCIKCNVRYDNIQFLDTLKKHYSRCHKETWDKIKKRNSRRYLARNGIQEDIINEGQENEGQEVSREIARNEGQFVAGNAENGNQDVTRNKRQKIIIDEGQEVSREIAKNEGQFVAGNAENGNQDVARNKRQKIIIDEGQEVSREIARNEGQFVAGNAENGNQDVARN